MSIFGGNKGNKQPVTAPVNAVNTMKKDASSLERRLRTPMVLCYKWFHFGILSIMTGIYFLLTYGLWILMTMGGKKLYLGCLSSYRVPNIYDPFAIRFIYFIDERVVKTMFMPAIVFTVTGILMLIIRHYVYKNFVEVEKQRTQAKFVD